MPGCAVMDGAYAGSIRTYVHNCTQPPNRLPERRPVQLAFFGPEGGGCKPSFFARSAASLRIFLVSRHALELKRVLEIFRDHFHSFGPPCTGMVGFTVRDLPAKKRVKSERAKSGWTTSYQCSRPGGVPY